MPTIARFLFSILSWGMGFVERFEAYNRAISVFATRVAQRHAPLDPVEKPKAWEEARQTRERELH